MSFFRYSKEDWWTREEKSEYIPVLSKDTPSLLDIIKHYKVVCIFVFINLY